MQDPPIRHQQVLCVPFWAHDVCGVHPGDAAVCHPPPLRGRLDSLSHTLISMLPTSHLSSLNDPVTWVCQWETSPLSSDSLRTPSCDR